MEREWKRLASFVTFPIEVPVSVIHLASAGFYYDGHDDDVVCFSCGARHSNWRCGDSAVDVHRHISPDCNFINGRDHGNVPISNVATRSDINCQETIYRNCSRRPDIASCNMPDTRTSNEIQTNHNGDRPVINTSHQRTATHSGLFSGLENCSNVGYQQSSDSTPVVNTFESGNCSERPRFPTYAVPSRRTSSFNKWPIRTQIDPHRLVQAGFFYSGFGDCVRCFFCGGGLRDWETQDDPWVEHARWFPRCPFVIQSQGNEFVNAAQHWVLEQQVGSMSFTPEAGDDKVSLTLNDVDEHNDSDLNNSIAAQSVMEMGYSLDTVQDAVRQMKKIGRNKYNAKDIMEVILENDAEVKLPPLIEEIRQLREHKLSLEEEIRQLREHTLSLEEEIRQLSEQKLCQICFNEPRCILLLPCGHLVLCQQCLTLLAYRKCPICRATITRTVRTYIT